MRCRGPCPGDHRHISAKPLADPCHLIDEEILVARKAFEAYLIISAVRRSVISVGAPSGAYRAATSSAAAASSHQDDPVRVEDVVDGRALAQELGVRDDRELRLLGCVLARPDWSPVPQSRSAWCSC